jgi:succinate dehydrogenase / fumarate reductase membrane anchor subunit
MEENFGSKRLVVGAHYGLRDWLAQRVTAVLTFVVIISLLYHAWIGMRDVWMDYVKPMAIKLALQVFTLVWLVGCAGWAVQVLWRL